MVLFSACNAFGQRTNVENIETKVENLLGRMTLDEKIGQLHQVFGEVATGTDVKRSDIAEGVRKGSIGSILSHFNFDNKIKLQQIAVKESRLGIPIVFAADVIHGYKTIFPIPLAQVASWDMDLIERIERIATREATADGQSWSFTPMVDVCRDGRWGRIMEGAGEDPFLGSRVAVARVKGIQGNDLSDPSTAAACVKHFAGYGFSEAGRDYNITDMSEQRLRETVLPPFQAAAKAGAATFMNGFNALNGVPASMNRHLLTDILRGEWGWKGLVVSDWNSFGETLIHGTAEDEKDASAKCLSAGSDVDMVSGVFQKGLRRALEEGRITQAQIDDAVRRMLRLKYALGLFEDPFRYLSERRRRDELEQPQYRATAREAATASMVLLKNNNDILPLKSGGSIKKVALIGPYLDRKATKDYLSSWTGGIGDALSYDASKVVTPAQALKPALEAMGFEVSLTPVCPDVECGSEDDIVKTMQATREADVAIIFVGERGDDCGESRSLTHLGLPRNQEHLINVAANTKKPVIMVLFNSRPLIFPVAKEKAEAILMAWQPGCETGNALADIITGKVSPSGKLPVTLPLNMGQIPIYYNGYSTGRPRTAPGEMHTSGYMDASNEPAWPFGFGLSYTTFSYSPIRLNKPVIAKGETLEATVLVTNKGGMTGSEVVQCYVRDLAADVTRPLRELKGFEKIKLAPGEYRNVTFKITAEDLSYWNQNLQFKSDPGKFQLFIGGNSQKTEVIGFELK